jgi:hypothetical protein
LSQEIHIGMIRYILGIFLIGGQLMAQSDVDRINSTIDQRGITSHISFLASDALQGRETGSQGLEAAASYISSVFIRAGVDTLSGHGDYLQTVPFVEVAPPDSASIHIGSSTLSLPDDALVLNGHQQNTTLPTVFVNHGQEADLANVDLRFKMAVSQIGDGENSDVFAIIEESRAKRQRVIDAGGMGLVEIYENVRTPWRFIKRLGQRKTLSTNPIGDKRSEQFPHMWVSTTDSTAIANLLDDNVPARFDMEGITKNRLPSANVVGVIPGIDPVLKDEYIIYSAHYDHVGVGQADETGDTIYNGARDNAVGTSAILSLAEYIADNPMKRSALFILFTAEEKGLLGSEYFVENPPVPLDQVKYCFNIDNGGYNDTSIVTVIGLTRTDAEDVLQQSCNAFGLDAIEDPAKEQGLFDRSDNVNFAKKGIPAPTFSLGFRSFDEEIFKYYHQPGDELETLGMDYIEKYVKSFILSAISIGNADQSFFWREGDKYYEPGKELYGN